jgi:hypothetical protein
MTAVMSSTSAAAPLPDEANSGVADHLSTNTPPDATAAVIDSNIDEEAAATATTTKNKKKKKRDLQQYWWPTYSPTYFPTPWYGSKPTTPTWGKPTGRPVSHDV